MPRRGPTLGDPTDFSYRINKVTKIIDGDTIDVILDLGFDILHKSRVRLFGIDTPESRTRNKEEKVRGLLSKVYLKDAIKKAKKLTIKTHKGSETGKFGRILGEFWVEEHNETHNVSAKTNINQLMIEARHAVAYHGQSKEEIAEEHIKNRQFINV